MKQDFAYNIANTLKFNAYRHVAYDIYSAKKIILEKKLAFGEPACVPFHHPNEDTEENKTMILIGVGGIDGSVYFFSNVMFDDTINIDNANVNIEVEGESRSMTLHDAFSVTDDRIKTLDASLFLADGRITTLDTSLFLMDASISKKIEDIDSSISNIIKEMEDGFRERPYIVYVSR